MNIPAVHRELHQVSTNEQKLYDHLLECVRTESPEQVLERFSSLFIKARGYNNQEVLNALASVVNSKDAESRFQFVLNRCCHILINRWQMQPQTQVYIPELIGLFDYLPPGLNIRYGGNFYARLQQLVKVFLQGDYYKQLQRLAEIVGRDKRTNPGKKEELVGNLINRYPYLYDHCLLSVDSSKEQQETVYKVKAQLEKKFEVNLSKYVTYQIRVAQASRNEELAKKLNIIQPVSNPTLLSDKDLGRSLKHYVGTVENGYTYQELSKSFITHTSDLRNYQSFKDELYEYIIMSIDSRYGKNHFNQRLYHKLQQIYPQYNHTKPDDFLKMRTYSQLFNYLVVESPNNPQHLVFMDLIGNMGTTKTIGMFLKLVLACSKVKPYLEKRFSILFNHYESFTKDGAVWLVRSLEKLNVAFCTNFGNLDLSFLRRIYAKN